MCDIYAFYHKIRRPRSRQRRVWRPVTTMTEIVSPTPCLALRVGHRPAAADPPSMKNSIAAAIASKPLLFSCWERHEAAISAKGRNRQEGASQPRHDSNARSPQRLRPIALRESVVAVGWRAGICQERPGAGAPKQPRRPAGNHMVARWRCGPTLSRQPRSVAGAEPAPSLRSIDARSRSSAIRSCALSATRRTSPRRGRSISRCSPGR
jgi:hypothetical protein